MTGDQGAPSRRVWWTAAIGAAWLGGLLLMGCGGEPPCVVGATEPCACADGTTSIRVCNADERFAPCECDDPTMDGGTVADGSTPGDDGGAMTGSGETVTAMIDPSGGEIRLMDATLTVPAGAVDTPTTITVTETTMPTPAGYRAFSPLYRFEPEGLSFATPVTVSIRSRASGADIPLGTLFWSRPGDDGGGWERRGGIPAGGQVTADVDHFSFGFIADGVDYTETPDRSCVRTRVLDVRTQTPSGVGLFFAMDDCWGRPLTDVAEGELAIVEDEMALSSEASFGLFEQRGLQVFITLAIDVSGSTVPILADVIGAARAFVETINEPGRGLRDRVQVAVQAFAGENGAMGFYQPHTLDLDLVLERLDELETYEPEDLASTNLHGAITRGLLNTAQAQQGFRTRNQGGAFTAGYLVLFTDGTDSAGRVSFDDARDAVEASLDEMIAVGLRGDDYDPAALRALAGERQVYDADSVVVLDRDFRHLAARVAGQVRRSYLLGYCSPKRSGTHTVYVGLRGAETRIWGTAPEFNANGFAGGCTPDIFDPTVACGDAECGGFGCGACDDRVARCDSAASATEPGGCVSNCVLQDLCDGVPFTNSSGYEQVCATSPEATPCDGTCVDTTNDMTHCGGCDTACSLLGASCVDSACQCPGGAPNICDEECVDLMTETRHCGACDGNQCFCSGGTCVGVTQIAASRTNTTCAVLTDGTARCWGANGGGQLGDGTTTQRLTPVVVSGLTHVAEIAVGFGHACARLTDGTARCWGANGGGQLGDGTTTRRLTPVVVSGLTDVAEIAVGSGHACARLTDGTARCWGTNGNGRLGDGTTTDRLAPVVVSGLSGVVEITAGNHHTCARLMDGTARCWGSNSRGQLGDGTVDPRTTPVAVSGLSGLAQIAGGQEHTCAVLIDGTARCWGGNDGGQLGDGTTGNHRVTPVAVSGLGGIAEISGGLFHTCAALTDGTARCWGSNGDGRLGDGTTTLRRTPVAVSGLTGVAEITAGSSHTCARLADGTARCWGGNHSGAFGDGTTEDSLTPVPIP